MTNILEVTGLKTNFYTYEGVVKALAGISLVIDHGSTFGLVGESGCGKSVAVRSVMRIVQTPGKIEEGKIVLFTDKEGEKNGIELLSKSEAFMRQIRGDRISMIFQEPNAALNPIMSIGEQISESFLFHRQSELLDAVIGGLDKSGKSLLNSILKYLYRTMRQKPESLFAGVLNRIPAVCYFLNKRIRKEALKRSVTIVENLGVPDPNEIVHRYPHQLSGGMKQRIVIAIALACGPELLIADEATSNLDVTIQAQILDLLIELKKTTISSVLLITHDLGVVAETCDRVGVMYAGSMVETALVGPLFKTPLHPYTRALLDAVPKFITKGKLKSIEGSVPNLISPPTGCRFHPRCPVAMDICSQAAPELLETKTHHYVACHKVNSIS